MPPWAALQLLRNVVRARRPRPSIRIRVEFGPGVAVGPAQIALLEQIADRGSLSKAARALGVSYRTASLLLQSLNASFEDPMTIGRKGGSGRGGTLVTPLGCELIRQYRRFEQKSRGRAASAFGALVKRRSS